jgi:hypothetical protein
MDIVELRCVLGILTAAEFEKPMAARRVARRDEVLAARLIEYTPGLCPGCTGDRLQPTLIDAYTI